MVRSRGTVRLSGVPTPWARMRRASWTLRTEADAQEVTFVAQDLPDVGADRGVVTIVAPPPTHAFAPTSGFQRLQGLATDQRATPDAGKQQQQVRRQMGQFAIAGLIQPPAPLDLLVIDRLS